MVVLMRIDDTIQDSLVDLIREHGNERRSEERSVRLA